MVSAVVAVLGLALAFLTAIHLLLPGSSLNGALSALPLLAHGFAFPLPGGLVLLVMGAVALLVLLRRRHHGDESRLPRMFTASSLVISGVLLTLCTTNVGLPSPLREDAKEGNASFVLVSWNALDHFDGDSAQRIFGEFGADVAVLPELENRDGLNADASRVREALAGGGLDPRDFDIFESPPTGTHIAPLTVIVRKEFGHYDSVAAEQVTFGTVHLTAPAGSGLPEILAVHTAPPVPRWMAEWETDLLRVRGFTENEGAKAIIAGDLNATLRHGAVGAITTHGDVLATVPTAKRGTWPASVPQILRSSIDHVLVPVKGYAVRDARVIDISGSDHAAIVTTISTSR